MCLTQSCNHIGAPFSAHLWVNAKWTLLQTYRPDITLFYLYNVSVVEKLLGHTVVCNFKKTKTKKCYKPWVKKYK